MKLVHVRLTQLTFAMCVCIAPQVASTAKAQDPPARAPEYLQHYNPARGFKPAQTSLADVFLQIAGSLEFHGSPEPYLRHMQKEHARVSGLFAQRTGKIPAGRMPTHMTAEYIDLLVKNWNTLAGPLKLDALARETGRCVREGMMGTRLTGTYAIQLLNEHQRQVVQSMAATSGPVVGFSQLKAVLTRELEFDRKRMDTTGYDIPRRDAVSYAAVIDGKFRSMFGKLDSIAAPEKAKQLKEVVLGEFLDLGYLAHSELEIGILELGLSQR